MKNRWVLLEHRLVKNNPYEFHFDLLLEEERSCRTWRLDKLPVLNGPSVPIISLPPHKLEWLERQESIVSGGRGWAQRIEAGTFVGSLPKSHGSIISIELVSATIYGRLELEKNFCRLFL